MGTPKNSWLVGAAMRPAIWLPELALNIYWYGGHFLAIAIFMLGVWMLALRLSGSTQLAWLELLTLNVSGIINFDIIPYNDNYLLVMLLPLMMLFFQLTITGSTTWWLAFALAVGLAMMAKYSTFAFVFIIVLATLLVPLICRCYRQPQFYLAVAVWLALVLPNLYWLWQHDFAALKCVGSQTNMQFKLGIMRSMPLVFYTLFFLWLILRWQELCYPGRATYRCAVLLWVYLLPLGIITCWLYFNVDNRLTEWLQPFLMLAPALLVSCVRQPPTRRSLRPSVIGLLCIALATCLGYGVVMLANVRNARQKMVGIKAFSTRIEQSWQQRYGKKLRYVGGAYLSQWMTVYVNSHPQTITRWSNPAQPNIYNAQVSFSQIV